MKPEKMFWYKFYIQDYQRDTGHLSLMEHGAYRLLIDKCFLSGGILPSSLESVYRLVCAMTKSEQEAVRSVLSQFFDSTSDGFTHKRVTKEMNQLNLAGSASRANGSTGGRPKGAGRGSNKEPKNNLAGLENNLAGFENNPAGKPKNNLTGFEDGTCQVSAEEPSSNPGTNPDKTLVISHKSEDISQESDIKTSQTPVVLARAREGSFPISVSWKPTEVFWDLAKRSGHSPENSDYADALTEFIAYWLTNPGESRTQSRWEKSFLQSWKNHRAHAAYPDRRSSKRPNGLSPHKDFEQRDYTRGINADGSF